MLLFLTHVLKPSVTVIFVRLVTNHSVRHRHQPTNHQMRRRQRFTSNFIICIRQWPRVQRTLNLH
jgi:hypothetical protein